MPRKAGIPTTLLALAVVGLVVLLLWGSYASLQANQRASGWVVHTVEVQAIANQLLAELVDAETGQRGYLLTGEERYLEPWTQAMQSLPGTLARLRALTADDPAQQQRLAKLETTSTSRLQRMRESIALRRAGDARGGIEVVRSGEGKLLMDELRRLQAEFVAAEGLLLGERQQATLRTSRTTTAVVSLAGLLLLAAGGMLFAINRDLGRRAALERQLRGELGRRERLNLALTRTNRELDQFAYVASHDLKAPLRGIANLAQWLEEDLKDTLTPGSVEQLHLLRGRAHRMEALINGILEYSRAGRVQGRRAPVDVGRLVAEAAELVSPPPGAQLIVASGLPTLETDKVPLQQVFANLLANAFKHSGRSDPRVEVSVADAGPFWQFAVKDNGPGIAPEYQERVWGIFQTLEARDKVEGTGIGLSIVRKLVEAHGGKAWIDSTPGAGATFLFTWPRQEPEQPQ